MRVKSRNVTNDKPGAFKLTMYIITYNYFETVFQLENITNIKN